MPKTSRPADELLAEDLADPLFQALWEASAVGRALGIWLVRYRQQQDLTFDGLAARLNLAEDRLAELESGDEDPPAAVLVWLSSTLGTAIELRIERGLPGHDVATLKVDATAPQAA